MIFIEKYNTIQRKSVISVHISIDLLIQTISKLIPICLVMFGNVFSTKSQFNHPKYQSKYVSAQKLKNEVNSPFNAGHEIENISKVEAERFKSELKIFWQIYCL